MDRIRIGARPGGPPFRLSELHMYVILYKSVSTGIVSMLVPGKLGA